MKKSGLPSSSSGAKSTTWLAAGTYQRCTNVEGTAFVGMTTSFVTLLVLT